jgi:DNA-binding MarR family transcriptional regulator
MPIATRQAHSVDAATAARLRLVINRLRRQMRPPSDEGMTPSRLSCLASIDRFEPISMSALAAREEVHATLLSRTVSHLEESGYVRRRQDSNDRRVSTVEMTAAGRRALAKSRARGVEVLLHRLDALNPRDVDAILTALPALEALATEHLDRPEGDADPTA